MSTPAELLLGTLRGELKTLEDQRRARDQCRLAIGGAGLVNGIFPVPEEIRDKLESSLKDARDRELFESETLKLDGWTYVQRPRRRWTGPRDGPSGSAASDPVLRQDKWLRG